MATIGEEGLATNFLRQNSVKGNVKDFHDNVILRNFKNGQNSSKNILRSGTL